ncbi:MAG: exodeoxyribonuclease VII small subunit [Lachnospiraceae bacterium]|nr:exodeoxyribonuclease VII small subunit [Lachnospiraceae bacterium]MBP5183788.1 exodeoxyribonuclease VII small subunit [Lachnospiraceae bacterium]
MNEVEELIKRMEDPECSLEDSFAYYSKGVGLLKKCSESIDKVEKEIEILEDEA